MASGVLPTTIRQPDPPRPALGDPIDVDLSAPDAPESKSIIVNFPDGSVSINLGGPPASVPMVDAKFDANLALSIESQAIESLAEELLRGIEEDERSRQDWLDDRATGIKLLALKIEKPSTSMAGSGSDNTSRTRHTLLLEAALRFQANARGEFLPADGPVKVEAKMARDTGDGDDLAQLLEDDMNYYLTTTASEYYPDTDRMLLWTGVGGCGIKKVYRCPIRRRPVSESVDAEFLIVSNAATDLANADRVTHVVKMRQSVMKRMMHLKVYRDIELGMPTQDIPNSVDEEKSAVSGISLSQRPEDMPYTLYECYCMIDVPGDEHKESGEKTGLPRPYKVTLDKTSRTILEVRRNWKSGDEMERPRKMFVKFPYVPGFGFYDIGLIHIAGNPTVAATALQRIMIDAGIFGNFPGFLYAKALAHQNTLDLNVPPGTGAAIDVSMIPDGDIRKAVMNMPYREPGTAIFQLFQDLVTTGSRVAGTADIAVGEGRADAPVGTTIALIEQATKVTDAVHKRLHTAQSTEFQMLRDLFLEYPEDFYKFNSDRDNQWDAAKLTAALRNYNLIPRSDPNTSSNMQRVMRAQALYQMAMASPNRFNLNEVQKYILQTLGIRNPAKFMADPNAAPPPDPKAQADLIAAQAQQLDAATKAGALQLKAATAPQDAASKAKADQMKFDIEKAKIAASQANNVRDVQAAAMAQRADHAHKTGVEVGKLLSDHALEERKHTHVLGQNAQQAELQPAPEGGQ